MNFGFGSLNNIFSLINTGNIQKPQLNYNNLNAKKLKPQPATPEEHNVNASKHLSELDKLARLSKITVQLQTISKLKNYFSRASEKAQKEPPKEGFQSNPFADNHEINAYYRDNFKHGRVVDPFEYRYKSPWLKYILFEKANSFIHKIKGNQETPENNDPEELLKATHLKQGDISNCWFIATLGTLAHKDPDFIKSIIEVDSENNCYKVSLKGGRETVSLIPININPHVVAKTGAAWAGILEAAVAKAIGLSFYKQNPSINLDEVDEKAFLHEGYKIMDNGNYCSYAVYYLTGKKTDIKYLEPDKNYPVFNFKWKDKSIILGNHHYEKRIYDAPYFDPNYDGLVSQHAYALIEQTDNNDLYLFNPWGMYEPGSRKNKIIEQINSKDNYNDGMFKYSDKEFLSKRCWQVYEILDEVAEGLDSVLHTPMPPPPLFTI